MTAESVHTVQYVADQLSLHPKTVLRFIREGRLKATRVGKSWRIRRSELARLAGVSAKEAAPEATMTAIVDLPGISTARAAWWARTVTSALNARRGGAPLRADVVHDPARSHLKVLVVGAPGDALGLLGLIHVWMEQR